MTTFKKGDRVQIVTNDSFNGMSAVVSIVGSDYVSADFAVHIADRGDVNYWFSGSELRKLPTQRRLTITPVDATTAAIYDGTLTHRDQIAADAVVIEGDFTFEIEEIDEKAYVQVKTRTYPRLTYVDPSGDLDVGDEVIVPLGYSNTESLGTVVDLGRGNYDGECKSVVARVAREAL